MKHFTITLNYLKEFGNYLGFIEGQGYTYQLNNNFYAFNGKGLNQL